MTASELDLPDLRSYRPRDSDPDRPSAGEGAPPTWAGCYVVTERIPNVRLDRETLVALNAGEAVPIHVNGDKYAVLYPPEGGE